MAFLVSVNFSTPLCTPKTLIQRITGAYALGIWRDVYLEDLEKLSGRCNSRRLVRAFTNTTVINILAPKFSDRDAWSSNRGCKPRVIEASRHLCETVGSPHFIVILGFWVGPDIEDGWGFVEALVHQIF